MSEPSSYRWVRFYSSRNFLVGNNQKILEIFINQSPLIIVAIVTREEKVAVHSTGLLNMKMVKWMNVAMPLPHAIVTWVSGQSQKRRTLPIERGNHTKRCTVREGFHTTLPDTKASLTHSVGFEWSSSAAVARCRTDRIENANAVGGIKTATSERGSRKHSTNVGPRG